MTDVILRTELLPERLALGCGRPVLVVPRHWEFHNIGQRTLLAWRGGRASSRALNMLETSC